MTDCSNNHCTVYTWQCRATTSVPVLQQKTQKNSCNSISILEWCCSSLSPWFSVAEWCRSLCSAAYIEPQTSPKMLWRLGDGAIQVWTCISHILFLDHDSSNKTSLGHDSTLHHHNDVLCNVIAWWGIPMSHQFMTPSHSTLNTFYSENY